MIPRKIDNETVNQLKLILRKYDIKESRVLIDFDNETVEVENGYPIDDLMEAAGALTVGRGKELAGEIAESREEWDE